MNKELQRLHASTLGNGTVTQENALNPSYPEKQSEGGVG